MCGMLIRYPWGLCDVWYPCKTHLNSKCCETSFAHNWFLLTQSFRNCAQSTRVILSCPVQTSKTIGQLTTRMLWTNEISRDLSLRRVLGGCRIFHSLWNRTCSFTIPARYKRFRGVPSSAQSQSTPFVLPISVPAGYGTPEWLLWHNIFTMSSNSLLPRYMYFKAYFCDGIDIDVQTTSSFMKARISNGRIKTSFHVLSRFVFSYDFLSWSNLTDLSVITLNQAYQSQHTEIKNY